MAGHDLRQRVEVSDDDRTVATAEVTTSEGSGGTARVSLRAEPGHITPGRRASLVDAVLDLPEVQQSARVEAAFRLGDDESLHRLQERCEDVSTRPRRVERARRCEPSVQPRRAARPGLSRPGTPAGRITTSEAIVPSDSPAAARASTKPASTSVCSAASSSAVTGARATRRSRTAARLKPGPPRLRSLSQQNERSRRYTFRNPKFTSDGRTRIDRARRPRYWVYRGTGGLRELWGYF